jgi:hypothetical protein
LTPRVIACAEDLSESARTRQHPDGGGSARSATAVRAPTDRPGDRVRPWSRRRGRRHPAAYAALAADEQRNRLIVNDVTAALAEGRSLILLTERKDHLDLLAGCLQGAVRHLVVLSGGMTPSERRAAAATRGAIPDAEPRLLVATGRYVGEGFDDATLDTLCLATTPSWSTRW